MHHQIASPEPPSPHTKPSFKPRIIYSNETSGTVGCAINATVNVLNATLYNASSRIASAAANLTFNTSAQPLNTVGPSGGRCGTEDHLATTPAITNARLDDNLSRTTMSQNGNNSNVSLMHLFTWFLFFVTITVTTVTLLNYCLRSNHVSSYAAEKGNDDEEMCGKAAAPFSVSTPGAHAEGQSSSPSSSSRLFASRGNLARQQFLESRKTGSTPKFYGATASTSPPK
ncbi:hypothetical protein, conserved [Leishmania tarentolae]|uniref:Transmembrane protein n=1 Tax=Leishmania tarentolae TaxID=5689 RepID=A0A640KJS7_LEITA|nr:hypothetical protein, conserved [Leishmania tarentolae]